MVRPVQILDSGGSGSNPSLVRHYFFNPVTCGTLGLTAWQDSKYIQLKGISSHYNSNELFDIMHSLCTELYIKSNYFQYEYVKWKTLNCLPCIICVHTHHGVLFVYDIMSQSVYDLNWHVISYIIIFERFFVKISHISYD